MELKELKRIKLFEFVKQGHKILKEVSEQLEISYRQTLRLYAIYKEKGDAGLIHGNCGKKPNNSLSEEFLKKVLEIYRQHYSGFGPTFASEKLAEDKGIHIKVSSLRKLLIESKDFPSCCLMTFIDDATNIRISRFFEQETTTSGMILLSLWINEYGIPESLYCDKKNAFVLTREPTVAELRADITEPRSYFGLACEELGIEIIKANSPQAKGRVERNHGVDQDRLVKELKLAGITTIDEANIFLEKIYLPKMNKKFSRQPAKSEDAHVPLLDIDLSEYLCYNHKRKVGNDYVVRFETRLFQILKSNKVLPRTKDVVFVRVQLDGRINIIWKINKLLFEEITKKKDNESRNVADNVTFLLNANM
jgi:hypothetical protein